MNSRAYHPKAILTEAQAIEIFKFRSDSILPSDPSLLGRTTLVAKKYKISPKAVRDIWNGRTWRQTTQHLWDEGNPLKKVQTLLPGANLASISRNRSAQSNSPYEFSIKRSNSSLSDSSFYTFHDKYLQTPSFEKTSSNLPGVWNFEANTSNDSEIATHEACPALSHTSTTEFEFYSRLRQEFKDPFHNDWPHW